MRAPSLHAVGGGSWPPPQPAAPAAATAHVAAQASHPFMPGILDRYIAASSTGETSIPFSVMARSISEQTVSRTLTRA